jgi:hypothetical protein
MKTPSWLRNTLLVVSLAFVCGIVCSLAGCGGTTLDLPVCQPPAGASIYTETCVDYQDMAICRLAPGPGFVIAGCVTDTPSDGDKAGIECVQNCPSNHYESDTGTSH